MKTLDIAEVANRSGLPASTLRYYEELGLISSIGRHGLRRVFAPDVLLRLGLIGLGREAGFSLVEIAGMLDRDAMPDLPRCDLHARAQAIDRQIAELQALSELLRHMADCPAPSHMECPTFRRLLSEAVSSNRRPRAARRRASAQGSRG